MTVAPVVTAGLLALALAPVAHAAARHHQRARLVARARRSVPGPSLATTPTGPAPGPPTKAPPLPPTSMVVMGLAGVVVAGLAVGAHAAVGLVALAAAGPIGSRLRRHGRQRRRRNAQLPAALDRLAAALRSGSSLTMALGEVGDAFDEPIGPELSALAHETDRGRPVRDALDGWSATHDDPGTRLAAAALVLATVIGSAPARAVDGVAATLRERLDLAAERGALAAQARTSALVLSVAPVGFAALLIVGDTAAAGFLLGTPAGWLCLAAGVGLDGAGAWWMARLSRSESW